MIAYLARADGHLDITDVAHEPPLYLHAGGRRYIYRSRTEDGFAAVYEEDETPVT